MIPATQGIDHIHVYVRDRAAAEIWYGRALGLARLENLESWSRDGGPLTLADAAGRVKLALFEGVAIAPASTIALATDAAGFMAWRAHLRQALGQPLEAVDHELSWSLYFKDPDGNGYEITSYDYAALSVMLANA
ncbi:VOC family protein [Chromobacterium phragmitis]|uniref:VOC family protein n=2 Tax=Chromobacterium amazonense TaxID=1382803 RepID=UPI0021B77116|nr:VOC family protein [Chromobacterium amazonense]MBM2884186.1 VOC family protein [Chromobacterium amazonense]